MAFFVSRNRILQLKWGVAWVILSSVLLAGCFIPNGPAANADELLQLSSGNTAWMLAATGLVLFMTPGLAFFYGRGRACIRKSASGSRSLFWVVEGGGRICCLSGLRLQWQRSSVCTNV